MTETFKVGDRVIGRPDQPHPDIRGQKATVTAVYLYGRGDHPMLNVDWDDKSGDRSCMKSLYANRFDLLEEPVETTTLKSGDRVRFKPGTNFEEMHLGSYGTDVTFEIDGDVRYNAIGIRAGAPWVYVTNFSNGTRFAWAYLDTLELADPPAEKWVPADDPSKVKVGTKARLITNIGSMEEQPSTKTGRIVVVDIDHNGTPTAPYYLFESDDKGWTGGHSGNFDDSAENRWWLHGSDFVISSGPGEAEPEILTEFKAQVWKVAMEAATEHDMCDVVQKTLAKVGIFEPPKTAIKIAEPPVGTTFGFLDSSFDLMFLKTQYGWAYLHKEYGTNAVAHGDNGKLYTFEEMASMGFRLFDRDGNAVCGAGGWNAEYLNERFKNA